ncbi:MAG: hypothetical protein HS111_21400 [Kofleriaceae bacterium]|nr:hypothetical protein [Kofleriaceae bacterium]MCL4223165.1 hypothetical protein [Myxococcales bacterium]
MIASLLLAAEDPTYTRFVFSPDFATLRPLSAEAHRASYVVFDESQTDVARLGRALWDHAERHLFDTARHLDQLDRDRLISLTTAFTALLLGPVACGAEFAEAWGSLWRRARRVGLLDRPWIRLQLAILGGYVGNSSPHVDWLLDPRMRPLDRLDTWLFTARGHANLLDVTARMIRGECVSPELCFDARQRTQVLRALADWVKMCMRHGHHFQNEAQALMLLTCLEELPADTTFAPRLAHVLREVESVQILEKARFWQILERTPPGPARERLRELWTRPYATPR